jgi:membrane-associated protease RseP (regulator of RpoE activity)
MAAAALAGVAVPKASGQVADVHRLAAAIAGQVVDEEAEGESEYWLGVSCTELGDDLRDELKLDEAKGVVVVDVVPDSPAAKAGLKKHDVLLAADDVDVSRPRDLAKAVRKAKSKDLKLTLVRDGERKEITAKPENRGEQHGWTSRDEEPFNVRIFRPGQVVPGHVAIRLRRPELPEDMTVTVTKHGKEPAKITVSQGEKTWQATDDGIDDLPEEVRQHVEAMLGRFSVPLPKGVGKVFTYIPNPDFAKLAVEEAQEASKRLARDAEKTAREAQREADAAQRKASEVAREAHRVAVEKAREARRAAEKVARDKADAAIAHGRVWIDKQLDEKFDELDRRLEELRGMLNSLRQSRKAEAPEKEDAETR